MKRVLLLLAVTSPSVFAHDFWIEPSTFHPAVGETVTTGLRVGDAFNGEPLIRSSQHLASFVAQDTRRQWDVPGREGRDPAGILRIDTAGVTIVGYCSKPWPHVVPAATFRKSLREEGLPVVEVEGEVRERFVRYAKTLLENGEGSDRAIGFRYELVRESGHSFRLIFEGAPKANALVVGMQRDGTRVAARTNAEGRVRLPLKSKGPWLVKSVHLVRAPADSGAEWESLWASLTFELR